MNVRDSEHIIAELDDEYETTNQIGEADLILINTCSVRETAENRIFGRLGWFAGLKAVRACEPGAKHKSLEEAAEYVKDGPKPLTVVVMGCMAERLLNSLKDDYPCVDYVVGTYAKHHFGNIITAVEQNSISNIAKNNYTINDAIKEFDEIKNIALKKLSSFETGGKSVADPLFYYQQQDHNHAYLWRMSTDKGQKQHIIDFF